MNTTLAQTTTQGKQRPHEQPGYWKGFDLYAAGKPITWCDTIAQARGWLYGEYAEKASAALECGGQRLAKVLGLVNPDVYSEEEVAGIIRQEEDSEERREAEYRRRGW